MSRKRKGSKEPNEKSPKASSIDLQNSRYARPNLENYFFSLFKVQKNVQEIFNTKISEPITLPASNAHICMHHMLRVT